MLDSRSPIGPRGRAAARQSMVIFTVAVLLAACSGAASMPPAAPSASPASVAPDGPRPPDTSPAVACAPALVPAPPPRWTSSAHPPDIAYALGRAGQIVAVPFVALRAPPRDGIANKILWISRVPRDGAALTITGHPDGAAAPIVQIELTANAGPGEIYPSIVDVPFPGCWVFQLRWGATTDSVSLVYLPRD